MLGGCKRTTTRFLHKPATRPNGPLQAPSPGRQRCSWWTDIGGWRVDRRPPHCGPEFCSTTQHPLGGGGWGVGWGLNPPPLDPDFIVGKNKFTKGNIDLGYFWNTTFWACGFQTPPPTPERKLCGLAPTWPGIPKGEGHCCGRGPLLCLWVPSIEPQCCVACFVSSAWPLLAPHGAPIPCTDGIGSWDPDVLSPRSREKRKRGPTATDPVADGPRASKSPRDH